MDTPSSLLPLSKSTPFSHQLPYQRCNLLLHDNPPIYMQSFLVIPSTKHTPRNPGRYQYKIYHIINDTPIYITESEYQPSSTRGLDSEAMNHLASMPSPLIDPAYTGYYFDHDPATRPFQITIIRPTNY